MHRQLARFVAIGLLLASPHLQFAMPVPAAEPQAPIGPGFADNLRVRVNGELRPLADVIRDASSDGKQKTYRQLRVQYGNAASGQLDLAKWCCKQKLAEEEQLHWKILLYVQPDHPEAIKALHLRRYRGSLLTPEEFDKAKQKEKQAQSAAERWRPEIRKLRQAIDHGDNTERAAAIRQLRHIQDPLAIPALEEVFPVEDAAISVQIVDVVANMRGQEATDALVRFAVASPDEYVRGRAAEALQSYPEHTYVPMLVAGLAAPIEMSSRVSVDPGRPIYEWYEGEQFTGRLVRGGLYNKVRLRSKYVPSDIVTYWSLETRRIAGWTNTGQSPDRLRYDFQLSRDSPNPDAPYEYSGAIEGLNHAGTRNRGAKEFQKSVADLEKEVKEANERSALLNQRIHAALTKATGVRVLPGGSEADPKNAEVDPRLWWNWWRIKLNLNNYFAAGTEVWTQTGLVPIEQVAVGDRVLARQPDSGELTFQLVIGIDKQPKSEVRIIEIGSRTIVATPEQPFFVPGDGWRPAKKLEPGMQLESLAGPRTIEEVNADTEEATYSLLVANVPNYFVDRQGILAHDATRPSANPKKAP